jgi:hypothetical protein
MGFRTNCKQHRVDISVSKSESLFEMFAKAEFLNLDTIGFRDYIFFIVGLRSSIAGCHDFSILHYMVDYIILCSVPLTCPCRLFISTIGLSPSDVTTTSHSYDKQKCLQILSNVP